MCLPVANLFVIYIQHWVEWRMCKFIDGISHHGAEILVTRKIRQRIQLEMCHMDLVR